VLPIVLLIAGAIGVLMLVNGKSDRAPTLQCQVVNKFPHDPTAYCQGLVYHNGVLYEGTGDEGRSSIRRVDLTTGRIIQRRNLADHMFGEGIAVWGKSVIQLTWKNRVALHYDIDSFELQRTTRYRGEGWGLTHDGSRLIMSDGTATLRFLDPDTFQVKRRLTVRDGRRRIIHLNELEYIDGKIYANIWYQDRIARISPQTGQVEAWIDLSRLLPSRERPHRDAVLNGIAYDAEQKRIFVTGKDWPSLFEIRVIE
jgi:glutamine cyclotransferase